MAQDWLHANTGLALVKEESVFGVNPGSFSAATNALYMRNMTVKEVVDTVDKKRIGPYHLSPGVIPGKRYGTFEFEMPLPGLAWVDSSATPIGVPDWDPLMKAANWVRTTFKRDNATEDNCILYLPTTYRSTLGQTSVTIQAMVFKDGADPATGSGIELWEINGAVCNVEFFWSQNEECYLKFSGSGLYNKPIDFVGNITNIAYKAPEDALVCQGAYVDTGAYVDLIRNLTVNMNWAVTERSGIGGVGGIHGFMLTRDGSITGSYEVEARLESARGRYDQVESAAGEGIKISTVTPQGIGIRFEMPNVQLGTPDASQDGVLLYSQPFFARDKSATEFDSQIGLLLTTMGGDETGIDSSEFDIF